METNLRTDDDKALHDAAEALMEAAMRYWREYRRVTGGAAVVWIKDEDGRMVVLTRGEYHQTLMRNIDVLQSDGVEVRTFETDN
jgi:hypothetical protein